MKSKKTCDYVYYHSKIEHENVIIRWTPYGAPDKNTINEIEDVCGSSRHYGDDGTVWDCDLDSAREYFGFANAKKSISKTTKKEKQNENDN